jgi:ribosomal protein S12 methylthiotransferase accessory factor
MIDVFFDGGKKVNAKVNGFIVRTDQSVNSGGEGTAPEPFTLFLASLATCAGIYVKAFCDKRDIPSGEITLTMETRDDPVTRLIDFISIKINVPAGFPEKYDSAVIS